MNPIYIGTSGWIYKSWNKTFYPDDIRSREHLEFYATQFPTVEINATFYRLPTLPMIKGWHQRAPRNFLFAVKGSRFITHMKKLANLNGGLNKFIRRIQPLKEHLGPVLWQLPPNLGYHPERLDRFLAKTSRSMRHAVEFRHPSWYHESGTFEVLKNHNAAHVSLSSQGVPMNLTTTADFVYIRFHGLKHGAAHDYTRDELKPWAEHIRHEARHGRTVFAYFNNDLNVRAPGNARMLIEMVDDVLPPKDAHPPGSRARARNASPLLKSTAATLDC
ncbi:MAG TPA: DUF72 domain-containing protein [Verrucomicrobiae bacterium]|nr:DUF72 domain-containing protein [Verrucomicrobiae bacterium]